MHGTDVDGFNNEAVCTQEELIVWNVYCSDSGTTLRRRKYKYMKHSPSGLTVEYQPRMVMERREKDRDAGAR